MAQTSKPSSTARSGKKRLPATGEVPDDGLNYDPNDPVVAAVFDALNETHPYIPPKPRTRRVTRKRTPLA